MGNTSFNILPVKFPIKGQRFIKIVSEEDRDAIISGLKGILEDVEKGTLEFSPEYEDIHSFVEANLIKRIGEAGKRLHTGRSRNDQVALDMKLTAGTRSGRLMSF